MKPFICFTLAITLLVTAGYAARDVTCYEMVVPDTNTLYLEVDAEIIPTLGIANLGNQAELNFLVTFMAIDTYGKLDWVKHDTVYAATVMVAYIGPYPDSIEVEFPEWTLEGVCHDTEPFVFYELMGVAELGCDEDQTNDTTRHNVTCLLSYDVGAIDLYWPECPEELPDRYQEGSVITPSCIVENFGYHAVYDIEVCCEVRDHDSNYVELWHSLQNITFLDWRGNPDGNPYTVEVNFPTYNVLTDYHMAWPECHTLLENDECPDNDRERRCINRHSVSELKDAPLSFSLDVPIKMVSDLKEVRFTVPHTSWVKLDVFDVDGRWVKSLENDIYEPGSHAVVWDGRDNTGRKTSIGVYFVRIQADEFADACKVVVIN